MEGLNTWVQTTLTQLKKSILMKIKVTVRHIALPHLSQTLNLKLSYIFGLTTNSNMLPSELN